MTDSINPFVSSAAQPTAASLAAAGKLDYRNLVTELREQNFDTVRFATYRTACKLRFIQKKFNLHLVDIWNIIESFRENGLNAIEYISEVKISRIELLLSTVYHNLNKRLPPNKQIDTDRAISLLLSFLLSAFDKNNVGKLRVFSIKVALASLCAGKLLDKLKYIFSQISDGAGIIDHHKFSDYLREVLSLPTAVFEGPTFGYNDTCVKQFFDPNTKVTLNTFLDALMADPCAPCLMWLPLLHRMASVEHVFHPVMCDACNRESFTGFRYKCQRCHNYQLCQECFWRGRVSGAHTNQHEMKEYSSYKSPTKQLGHSISKSLQCMPHHTKSSKLKHQIPEYQDRPLDLSNVVPASPSLMRQHRMLQQYSSPGGAMIGGGDIFYDSFTADSGGAGSLSSPGAPRSKMTPMLLQTMTDDEHKLIARYSAKLAGQSAMAGRNNVNEAIADGDINQRSVINQLQQKNKEITREIQRLQAMQAASNSLAGSIATNDSGLTVELDTLRHRKYELECRMQQLQDTRKDLMAQLETVMSVLKTQPFHEGSPRSPNNSLTAVGNDVQAAFQQPTTSYIDPTMSNVNPATYSPQFNMTTGQMYSPDATGFSATGSVVSNGSGLSRRLPVRQVDLLFAADSITNTMSSLVKELDSDDENKGGDLSNAKVDGRFQQHAQLDNMNNVTSYK